MRTEEMISPDMSSQLEREKTLKKGVIRMSEEAPLLQPSEEVIAQRTLFCFDQEVLLVLTQASVYVSLPNSCAVLGLNTRGQLQRLQRTATLQDGLRQLTVQTRGGIQRVN